MALPNLTREQAAERAALVTVDNYRIALDLTDGEGKPGDDTFRSVTTVQFEALAGADTYIDIAADSIRSATLNGRDLDVSGYDESTGIPLQGLAQLQPGDGIRVACGVSVAGSGLMVNVPFGFCFFSRAMTQLPWTRPRVFPVAASAWLAS